MQVKCTKCSEPIALTDNVESSDGRVSHEDCKRPQVLSPEERALVFVYCANHPSPTAFPVTRNTASRSSQPTCLAAAVRTCVPVVGAT